MFTNRVRPTFIYTNTEDFYTGVFRRIAHFGNFLGLFFHAVSINAYAGLIPDFNFYQQSEAIVKAGLLIAPITTFLIGLMFLGYVSEIKTGINRLILGFLVTACQLSYMIIWTIKLNVHADINSGFLFEFGWATFGCFLVAYFVTIFDYIEERKNKE